jgi:signal transduction histidine kinase
LRDGANEALLAQQRIRSLATVRRIVAEAESGIRGYVITNDPAYLKAHEYAEEMMPTALERVRDLYPSSSPEQRGLWWQELEDLVSRKMEFMRVTLAAQQEHGPAVAAESVRSDVGLESMEAVAALIEEQQLVQIRQLEDIQVTMERDLLVTRALSIAGTLLNVLLVILAGRLVTREVKRRLAEGKALEAQKQELEQQVATRTEELSELTSYVQEVSEKEKSVLARELHDELGGLLVAARMDISALRRKSAANDPDSNLRWERVLSVLDAGVNLKRRVVDRLHPTLLDTMGLFAAIRWHFEESCRQASLKCGVSLPEEEIPLSPEAAIAIFRIAQEAMTNIQKHARAGAAELRIQVEGEQMVLSMRDDGVGVNAAQKKLRPGAGWSAMRHRVEVLGGRWLVRPGPDGRGTEIEVRLPMKKIRAAAG